MSRPTPTPTPDDDAGFAVWVEAKASERNARGGMVTPTPDERARIDANLRGGCDQYPFSADALAWLNQYQFCGETADEPPTRT